MTAGVVVDAVAAGVVGGEELVFLVDLLVFCVGCPLCRLLLCGGVADMAFKGGLFCTSGSESGAV